MLTPAEIAILCDALAAIGAPTAAITRHRILAQIAAAVDREPTVRSSSSPAGPDYTLSLEAKLASMPNQKFWHVVAVTAALIKRENSAGDL